MSRKPTVREQIEEINERFNPRGTNVLSANSLELKVM